MRWTNAGAALAVVPLGRAARRLGDQLGRRSRAPAAPPFRDALLSAEALDDRARALAAHLTLDVQRRHDGRALLRRFEDNVAVLRAAYRTLASDVRAGRFVGPGAEWILDNFHLIAGEIADIRRDMPSDYSATLPALASRDYAGQARVYAMAVEIVRHSDSRLSRAVLIQFLEAFQRVAPLTLGELWAWPSMLKLALVENLRRLAEELLAGRDTRLTADAYVERADAVDGLMPVPGSASLTFLVQVLHRSREYGLRLTPFHHAIDAALNRRQITAEDAVRDEYQQQGVALASIANAVTSLRLCSTLDWRDFVESVSLVESVLQRDPAGVHGRTDFLSRDQLRHAVESLAPASGDEQVRVALKVVELARQAAARDTADPAAHVGFHLSGPGRRTLEAELAYKPEWSIRFRRLLLTHATAFYLGSIAVGTAVLVALAVAYARHAGASPFIQVLTALVVLPPLSDFVIVVVHYVASRVVAPRRLPRLDFLTGVPDSARTMVVVPTLLTNPASVDALLEHVEVLALGNLDPCIHFALLTDFTDSDQPEREGDETLLARARSGIEALNRKYGPQHADRFFLFHRHRQWNAGESTWMGWERKRGKLEEFSRLLRGFRTTSFSTQVGALDRLPLIRYCLTLDSDTRLPRDAARRLIGIAAHPLHRPRLDPVSHLVVEGYGILQPRVSVTLASADGSLFARLYAGHTGVDPYTTAVSDVYQDLFGEGIFTGKGLYDVDAFAAALDGRVPDNALLSHDLFEGLYARVGLVTDVEVVDDYPSTVVAHARRQHRWVRGDWQIIRWLLPWVPMRDGSGRNPLSLLARWKILDNLRRSLTAPTTLLLLVLGWTVLPGKSGVWTAVALASMASPLLWRLAEALGGPGREHTWRSYAHVLIDDLATRGARLLLQVMFLVHDAGLQIHAIATTLIRLGVTRRRLLQWETMQATAARGTPALFTPLMWTSAAVAILTLSIVAARRPEGLLFATPAAVAWLLTPWIAWWLSRPLVLRPVRLAADDRLYLEGIARQTWSYFDRYMTAEDHDLPPDNVQVDPDVGVAHRTSPTNIGLALMATLGAHDMGFIDTAELVERVGRTLATVERLRRWEGHLLNWYDTRTLEPLTPLYVSTVDSGNLAAALIVMAVGLRDIAPALAARATALVEAMNFRPLLEPRRNLFSIGYRLADADAAGRLDDSYYDLLASEARLASFLAIARGDAPESHWFRLGRPVTDIRGAPVLLSWSGTLFEYLMPLLVMRSHPGTLLDASCRRVVARQMSFAATHGVPWGISESAYNLADRFGVLQYKAFGVPGLGLKRGLGHEIVVAPYASALALALEPLAATANLRRLEGVGLLGTHGFYDAIDYTPRGVDPASAGAALSGVVVSTFMAHHQGMTLVALVNALLANRMVERFHADVRVQATSLLLQERLPRNGIAIEPRPDVEMPAADADTPNPAREFRTADTQVPHTQFLSNGRYVAAVTNAGGGGSTWKGLAITRWRRDATRDADGQFVYLRDVRSGDIWSVTSQPTGRHADEYTVSFRSERATFRRRDGDISTVLDVAVAAEDDVEVRRIAVRNHGSRVRELDVTSYAELVLGATAQDIAHPAFGKLFIQTEAMPECAALLAHRRPRDPADAAIWVFHVLSLEGSAQGQLEWETDRARFLGRGRTPANPVALDGSALSGSTGTVLDPIVSLRQRIRVPPGGTVRLCFATGVAADRDTASALARKYHAPNAASRTLSLALTDAMSRHHHLGISTDDAVLFERLASRVIGADSSLRAAAGVIASNRLGQRGLWPHAISGDAPILLVRVVNVDALPLIRQVLQAQEYWRFKGLTTDVVILNGYSGGYLDEMQAQLAALVNDGPWSTWQHRPGGAYVLRMDGLTKEEQILLEATASAVLHGDAGDLRAQLERPDAAIPVPAPLSPLSSPRQRPAAEPLQPAVILDNGVGGFVDGGRGYAFTVDANRPPPLPWVNIIANPNFGTIVTSSGAAHTWAGNSRENRLSPFANDPIADPTSEAIFVRDDETGEYWSPTPGPAGPAVASPYLVQHAPGLTTFTSDRHGLAQVLEIFVDEREPVKFQLLTLTNRGRDVRTLSLFAYTEWALAPPRERAQDHIVTSVDADGHAIFAVNRYSDDFAGLVAFAATSDTPLAVSGDRRAFLGRNGSLSAPAAMGEARLPALVGARLDACAALQIRCELAPGERRQFVVLLGQGTDDGHARTLIARLATVPAATAARDRVLRQWDDRLGALQVHTPDDSFDVLVNRWLLYQTIVCRLWTRGGYYQPGGAFGFRDQLQDVLALLLSHSDLAREHILRAAGRQFVEGDVQHWWHEPSGRGLRSRCADDLLWLPYVVAEYIAVTGDAALLDTRVPYLVAPLLEPNEVESYSHPTLAAEDGTLYEHCLRAIDRGATTGPHGLPLFGSGDWNDGMNRVGREGRGESTWLGFFLHGILRAFADFARARGDGDRAARYQEDAARLAARLAATWDGDWYLRGYYDDGSPLGSAQNQECRIDSIAQSWAVLSGIAPAPRAERAMDAVRTALIDRRSGLVLLLDPPFDQSPQDPGYIKGYPPGVRENGGQYTHAAAWVVLALARQGSGDEAAELFHMLNPINHARTRDGIARYQAEPYVVAGDVYSRPPHAGRAGWTWYTGSAAWLYRAATEGMLGLRRRGATFAITPSIPSTWAAYEIAWTVAGTVLQIAVENPERVSSGVVASWLDGERVEDPTAIPLPQDGGRHQVRILLGRPRP